MKNKPLIVKYQTIKTEDIEERLFKIFEILLQNINSSKQNENEIIRKKI